MEKLKKISKVVNLVFIFAFFIVVAQFIMHLVNWATNPLALLMENPDADTFKISGMDIGIFELDFREKQNVAAKYLLKEAVIEFVVAVLSLAASVFVIGTLRKILKPMMYGQPYDGTVSKSLRNLGVSCILFCIVGNVISYLQYRTLHSAFFEIVNSCLFEEIEGIKSQFSIQLGYLFIGIMLLVFSLVFRYGEELQVQADETL